MLNIREKEFISKLDVITMALILECSNRQIANFISRHIGERIPYRNAKSALKIIVMQYSFDFRGDYDGDPVYIGAIPASYFSGENREFFLNKFRELNIIEETDVK